MIHIYDANAHLRTSLHRKHLGGVHMDPRLIYERSNANPEAEFWVWDGPKHNDRRRAIFPGYKIRDYTGQENIFAGLQLYRDVLEHSRAVQIEVPGWEADDVCYTLAKHFVKKGEQVTVYTNDFDFHQMHQIAGIKIKGMQPTEGVEPRYVSLYKALRGDSSDKIPGIPGFGKKTWDSFAGIYHILDQALRERDANAFRAQPFKPSIKAWLLDDANMELVFVYYEITQMLDVPIKEIEAHMKPGVPDPSAALQLLARFMF